MNGLSVSTEDEMIQKYGIQVFPNPMTDVVKIKSDISDNFDIRVYSLSGVLMKYMQVERNEEEVSISLENLEDGVYLKEGKLLTDN